MRRIFMLLGMCFLMGACATHVSHRVNKSNKIEGPPISDQKGLLYFMPKRTMKVVATQTPVTKKMVNDLKATAEKASNELKEAKESQEKAKKAISELAGWIAIIKQYDDGELTIKESEKLDAGLLLSKRAEIKQAELNNTDANNKYNLKVTASEKAKNALTEAQGAFDAKSPKYSLSLTLNDMEPDTEYSYRLNFLHNFLRDDDFKISVNKRGLLSSSTGASVGRADDIIAEVGGVILALKNPSISFLSESELNEKMDVFDSSIKTNELTANILNNFNKATCAFAINQSYKLELNFDPLDEDSVKRVNKKLRDCFPYQVLVKETSYIESSGAVSTNNRIELADTNNESEVVGINNESELADTNNESEVVITNNESELADTNNESEVAITNNESEVAITNNESEVVITNNESEVAITNNESELADTNNESEVAGINNESEVAGANNESKAGGITRRYTPLITSKNHLPIKKSFQGIAYRPEYPYQVIVEQCRGKTVPVGGRFRAFSSCSKDRDEQTFFDRQSEAYKQLRDNHIKRIEQLSKNVEEIYKASNSKFVNNFARPLINSLDRIKTLRPTEFKQNLKQVIKADNSSTEEIALIENEVQNIANSILESWLSSTPDERESEGYAQQIDNHTKKIEQFSKEVEKIYRESNLKFETTFSTPLKDSLKNLETSKLTVFKRNLMQVIWEDNTGKEEIALFEQEIQNMANNILSNWLPSTLDEKTIFSQAQLVMLPNKSDMTFIPMQAGIFGKSSQSLTFKDGIVTEWSYAQSSEVLEIVRLPLEILTKALEALPLQLRYDNTKVEAVQAEQRLLLSQQTFKLLKNCLVKASADEDNDKNEAKTKQCLEDYAIALEAAEESTVEDSGS